MAGESVYGLTAQQSARLSRLLSAWEQGRLNQQMPLLDRPPTVAVGTFIGKVTDAITARSGSTPGTGTVSLYTVVSGALVDLGEEEDAWNLTESAIAVDAWVTLVREPVSGSLFVSLGGGGPTGEITYMTNVTFEDCILKRYFRVATFADGVLTIGDEYTDD